MNDLRKLWLAAILLAPPALSFAAQSPALDPSAAAPAVTYKSAFEGYQAFQEQAPKDWRALNAEVGAVGGHVGIMGGAGGHAGHGASTQPSGGKPPAVTTEGGQPPMRSAPKAPAGSPHQH